MPNWCLLLSIGHWILVDFLERTSRKSSGSLESLSGLEAWLECVAVMSPGAVLAPELALGAGMSSAAASFSAGWAGDSGWSLLGVVTGNGLDCLNRCMMDTWLGQNEDPLPGRA